MAICADDEVIETRFFDENHGVVSNKNAIESLVYLSLK